LGKTLIKVMVGFTRTSSLAIQLCASRVAVSEQLNINEEAC
jgi:hypothetical protein